MDVIAGTAFGVHVNTLENPDDPFNRHGIDAVRKNAWLHSMGGCKAEIYPFTFKLQRSLLSRKKKRKKEEEAVVTCETLGLGLRRASVCQT